MTPAATTTGPRVPGALRAMVSVECAVVGWAAALMLASPALAGRLWAWPTEPFNARYIGAVYLGALVPLVMFARRPYHVPGRVVLPMILVFTSAIAAVMLLNAGRFAADRLHAWVFWALYLLLPVGSGIFLHRLRGLAGANAAATPPARRAFVTAVALINGGYGVMLLAVPDPATGWWPWPVDAFHSRIYAATFLTAAVGAWLLRSRGAPGCWAAVGSSLATLGVVSAAGTLVTGLSYPLDFIQAVPFLAANLTLAAAGGVMLLWSRPSAGRLSIDASLWR